MTIGNNLLTVHDACPYSDFFLSIFFRNWTEYGEVCSVNLRIQSKCGKIRTRKTTNTQCLGLGLIYAHFLGTNSNYVLHFLWTNMSMKIEFSLSMKFLYKNRYGKGKGRGVNLFLLTTSSPCPAHLVKYEIVN